MFSSVLYFLLRFRQRTQVKFVGCFKPAWQSSKAKRWGWGEGGNVEVSTSLSTSNYYDLIRNFPF